MKPDSEFSERLQGYSTRMRLIGEAISRIYLKLGGQAVNRALLACERTILVATRCRESEARMLAHNPDARWHSGEKPMVSVSAGLAAMREMRQYLEQRERLRSQAKAQVEAALETLQPASLAELKEVLDSLSPDEPGQNSLAAEERELVEQEARLLREELPALEPAKRRERVEVSASLLRSLLPGSSQCAEELLRSQIQAALAA